MKKKNLDLITTFWRFISGGLVGLIWYFLSKTNDLTNDEGIRMLWFAGCFTIGLFLTVELVANIVAELEYNPGKWPFIED
jgi:hypothetical protein